MKVFIRGGRRFNLKAFVADPLTFESELGG
jgi:hypothetical protein